VRERTIEKIVCTNINNQFMYVDLLTQAGTYVKEFVHSDLGRTKPSLATLMDWGDYECEILLLDVIKIELDFPPEITTDVHVDVPTMEQELYNVVHPKFPPEANDVPMEQECQNNVQPT